MVLRRRLSWPDWALPWSAGAGAGHAGGRGTSLAGNGLVVSNLTTDEMPPADWPANVWLPSGMGDARILFKALAGDACIVIGRRAHMTLRSALPSLD